MFSFPPRKRRRKLLPTILLISTLLVQALTNLLVVTSARAEVFQPTIPEMDEIQSTKFYVVPIPEKFNVVKGNYMKCQYFGHMYSFEYSFTEYLQMNSWHHEVDTPEEADFIVLPHCVTWIYHIFRYSLGYNTVDLTWEALKLVQTDYLIPMIEYTESLDWFEDFKHKMVIVYAMDKGRVDYPLASERTKDWHAITTVGSNDWLKKNYRYFVGMEFFNKMDPEKNKWDIDLRQISKIQNKLNLEGNFDPCVNKTSISQRAFVWYSNSYNLFVYCLISLSCA